MCTQTMHALISRFVQTGYWLLLCTNAYNKFYLRFALLLLQHLLKHISFVLADPVYHASVICSYNDISSY